MLSSIGAYLSVTFVLLLIKHYSTTYAECVKGMRKVISIFISYMFLAGNKAFGTLHTLGISCFVLSIAFTIYDKYLKSDNSHNNRTTAKANKEHGSDSEKEVLMTNVKHSE